MERFGGWRLDTLIAVGGVGEVWRATGAGIAEVVALKRLHTHLVRNAEARAQFAVEQRLTTTLPRHRHLVHGELADEVDGRPFIALTLAPGDDLRKIITAPTVAAGAARPAVVLAPARAVMIAIAACEAAAHLHVCGWVHGDINPANLVIDAADDGDGVVLVDLGVIREIGAGGTVRGTHVYMAPEQVRGEAWTPATDVFALGVVLWELLAGRRLFHRGPTWLSAAAVVEEAAPALADVDVRLDAIVQAALAKSPADRIATAGELARRLAAPP